MDAKTKALQMCLTKRLPHHKKIRPVETECFSCFEYEQDLLYAYSEGVRDGEIKAYEDVANNAEDLANMTGNPMMEYCEIKITKLRVKV